MPFFLAQVMRDDLLILAGLAASAAIRPVIDWTYPLREAAEAIRYIGPKGKSSSRRSRDADEICTGGRGGNHAPRPAFCPSAS